MLMGLVTKNAILLIDLSPWNMGKVVMMLFYKRVITPNLNDHKCDGHGYGSIGLGEGGEQSAPMAHAVIGSPLPCWH